MTKSMQWNLISFNVAWFGLVFIGNPFIPIAILLLGAQLLNNGTDNSELVLILFVAEIGVLLDLALVYIGIFTFPGTNYLPLWLITLWFCFAGTIRHSLGFLAKSRLMQLLVGAFLAPLSYIAGAKAGVVYLSISVAETYVLLAGLWGPLMLVIFALSRWIKLESPAHA